MATTIISSTNVKPRWILASRLIANPFLDLLPLRGGSTRYRFSAPLAVLEFVIVLRPITASGWCLVWEQSERRIHGSSV